MNPIETAERPSFETIDGDTCYLIKVVEGKMLFCWKEIRASTSEGEYACGLLNPRNVDKETLEGLGVWSKLDTTIRSDIESGLNQKKVEAVEKMEKARRGRKKKDPNLPEYLECKCGYKTRAVWSALNKKADQLGIPAIDLAKNYQCQKCNPTKGHGRGKKREPVELVCKCGHKVTYPASTADSIAKKKGITVQQLVKGYKCQTCHPTKGRKKKN